MNPIRKRDRTAWSIFIDLLLIVNKDGEWEGGRWQLHELTGYAGTTIYDALRRLQNAKMLTTSPTANFTTISICNWAKYQSATDNLTDIKPTADRHSYKNKELRIIHKKEIYKEKKTADAEEAQKVLKHYNLTFQKQLTSSVGFEDNLKFWLTIYSLEDILRALTGASAHPFWGDKITPAILLRQKNPRGEKVDYISDLIATTQPRSPTSKPQQTEISEEGRALYEQIIQEMEVGSGS